MSEVRKSVAELAAQKSGPLAGTLVLELCGDEPSGTFGTQILADLGATVVKLERLPADELAPTDASAPLAEDIAYFWGLNRNKLSLALDLKKDEGRALFYRLAAIADVFYDNFRPEVVRRIGADAATLRAINPELICCSVSGFGRSGPLAEKPAYDVTVQALGGGMSLTGTGEPGSPPVRWGNPIGGIAGALYAVTGILAALARRRAARAKADGAKQGATLDIALLDAQLAMHAYRVPPALGSGVLYAPTPHRGGSGALPYGPFKARCGRWFALGITSQFWPTACAVLEHPEWEKDPRFVTEAKRQENEAALNSAVGAAMAARDAEDWQARFIKAGIPGATVRSIPEAFEHPHVALRDMKVGFEHPIGSKLKVAGNPIKLSGHAFDGFAPAPGLGSHTRELLGRLLGLSEAELAALREQRVAWWPVARDGGPAAGEEEPATGEVYRRPSVV